MSAHTPDALFHRDGRVLHPTSLTRGPWDHGFLHGGAVCGAVGWALESMQDDPGLMLGRLTVEIRSMVPVAPLRTEAWVAKSGKRTRVLEATLSHEDRVLVRATSQWLLHDATAPAPWTAGGSAGTTPARTTSVGVPEAAYDPGARDDMNYPRPGFNCDAVELRPVRGTTEDEGPGLIWVRLRHPVVAGEPTSPTLVMTALADLGVAVGWQRSPRGAGFINPDLTLQLNRPLQGDWVLMAARVHASAVGVGFCETVLSDEAGLFGRVLQSLVETPDELGVPGS